MRAMALAIMLVTTAALSVATAQQVHSVVPAQAAVCLRADGPIEVDGDLGDAAWQGAIMISGMTVSGGDALAANQTEFALLHDDEALYVGVRCLEENMQGLKTDVRSRDGSVWQDDVIELFVDIAHDHEHFLQFAANAIATRFDARTGAATWDADWQAAASIEADGWNLELRIPFASMEVAPPAEGDVWGLNLCRERLAGGSRELHNWANVEGNFHRPWLFGHVWFAGADFELTPEIARAMYAGIEAPVRLALRDGYALIGPEGVQERLTCGGMLAEAFAQADELRAMHEDLAQTYREQADVPFEEEFAPLDERYRELRAAASAGEVSALTWATKTVEIGRLAFALNELRWKVKVALLLREA